MENIVIERGDLRVEISPLGAELQSVKKSGVEVLYDGSASWKGRAPHLFPFAGRLKNAEYYYGGKKYSLGIHGFARKKVFEVTDQEPDSVTLLLQEDDETLAVYPFQFCLFVTYTVSEGKLTARTKVINAGEEEMLFAYGNHEGFVCDADKSKYTLEFEKAEHLVTLETTKEGLLSGTGIELFKCATELPLKGEYFAESNTLIFSGLSSRKVTLKKEGVPLFAFRFETDNLLIWSADETAPFLCIEPWTNLPDYADGDQIFENKGGVLRLAPAEEKTISREIVFE